MRKKSVLVTLLVAVVLMVMGFAVAVYAAEGTPPWADLEIHIGGVVLMWAGVQTALVQLLKSIEINGRRIVEGKGRILLANAIIGGIGLILSATMAGTPLPQALLSALAAVLASVGLWEHVGDVAGKSSAKNVPGGT